MRNQDGIRPRDLTSRVGSVLIGLLAVALACLLAGPARATEPTTPVERAVVLAEPGVVFVKTSVRVGIRLTVQDASRLSGLASLDGAYTVPYATGSGFVVAPDGAVVTASHVVDPDAQRMRNYAANRLFFATMKPDEDPFVQYEITDDVLADGLLQDCYKGLACHFSIKPIVSVLTPVQIAGVQTPKGLTARILRSTGFHNTDVAVLDVEAQNLPTVSLARSVGDLRSGQDVLALGFPGTASNLPTGVTEPIKLFGHVSNVRTLDTGRQVEVDLRALRGTSGGPVVDDNGQAIGLVSYTLLDASDATQVYLRTIDDVRAALQEAGIQPSRGPTDTLFAQGMSYYWARHYSAALSVLQKVLNLDDGHPLAKQYLALAQTKAGGPEDVPEPAAAKNAKRQLPLGRLAIVGAVVVLVSTVFLVIRRRRAARHTDGPRHKPSAGGPPGAAAVPPGDRVVGFPPDPVVATCRACGSSLAPSGRFCSFCGRSVA